ncbi:protein of unknown function UPF0079 [Ammonifex degensii KC4]|uniref:tRNA threonylcarbamoyladenosine biosynthesis protein TsaE n=1 Tax=Ammonifex degensii (strain DSM 10501 / KC4) TaxID=429009 RepID=C9RAP2_AMMDK|nr:tRNA (adenosine(37)-N6)-threonylcarbamoyltransferase complex ATPase subunit type 1 TsaE [Ammonifex degensii]ACX51319.1 protein of unknown function UPF0079 [Ammonifex degensii KC4]
MSLRLKSRSPEETQAIGEKLGGILRPGDIVALEGELGAGKTCFVRGLARALGVREPVASPSFVLVREYRGERFLLYHFDAYRLEDPRAFWDLGVEEYFASGISVIEWAEKVAAVLPEERLEVRLEYVPDNPEARFIEIEGYGRRGKELLEALRHALGSGN